jgi:hypothetical protein
VSERVCGSIMGEEIKHYDMDASRAAEQRRAEEQRIIIIAHFPSALACPGLACPGLLRTKETLCLAATHSEAGHAHHLGQAVSEPTLVAWGWSYWGPRGS